jgi:hypothetical protein
MSATLTDRDREKAKLARLSDIADRLAGDVWHVDADGDKIRLISRRSTGEDALLLTIHGDALHDEIEIIAGALDHLFLFLGLRSRAVETVQALRAELDQKVRRTNSNDLTRRVSIMLSDRTFQRFLETRGAGGPVRDKTAADTRLKSVLDIGSKTLLNTDERAKQACLKLLRDYDEWKRGGR